MKKRIVLLLACFIMQMSAAFAAEQIKVIAAEEFKTEEPSETIDVIVPEESVLGGYTLGVNSVLHCKVMMIIEPKRGKRNAAFFVRPLSYTYEDEVTQIEEEMYGKYSKFVLSKEELKKVPPFKVLKSAALSVGNYFVKGVSVAYYFVEGVVKNEEGGRIKSGAKKAYNSTPFSYISEGEQLDIKVGDEFYFVFKHEHEEE